MMNAETTHIFATMMEHVETQKAHTIVLATMVMKEVDSIALVCCFTIMSKIYLLTFALFIHCFLDFL